MRRRTIAALVLGLLVAFGYAPVASAHGERAQEAFLREKTTAFYDVTFSTDTVKQGEPLTITGTVKILETWPTTLKPPEVGYIGVSAPGPVMVMKERTVNGEPAPGSIFVKKGGVYQFKMVLEGRRPGQWHIHPILAIEGAGSLLGPGQWITVEPAAGGFRNLLTLFNGQTINLENYGLALIVLFPLIGLALGLWWMIYWTVPKRTVTRLAVTSQLPLNDDGAAVGLITRSDHKWMNVIAGITVVVLGVGLAGTVMAYPVTIPQQVVRFEPPDLPQPPHLADAQATAISYDPSTKTLAMEAKITNVSDQPIQVTDFITSYLDFVNKATVSGTPAHTMTVDPADATIAPKQTKTVKLRMQDPVWEDDLLVPMNQPQMDVAGVLVVTGNGGVKNYLTVEGNMVPTRF